MLFLSILLGPVGQAGRRADGFVCKFTAISFRRWRSDVPDKGEGRLPGQTTYSLTIVRKTHSRIMPLPPLNAVKAFEAAGRLENFSQAAVELNVTPSAISRQIKNLEHHLSVDRFSRVGNEVRITAAGRLYLGYVQEAFAKLG